MNRYGNLLRMESANAATFGSVKTTDGSPPNRLEKVISYGFRGLGAQHPCIGARSVLTNGNFFFSVIADMKNVESALHVVQVIERYLEASDSIEDHVKTLALFFTDSYSSAQDFAKQYWWFIQIVHDIDMMTNTWDANVSDDVSDPHFELSIAGRAIFTTTLNPGHPRPARRSAYPTWVCNQTRQFEQLRQKGQFENWQNTIRKADADLDPTGAPNPLLADHGYASAAQQLAGWPVDPCPLLVRRTPSEKLAAAKAVIAAATARSFEPETIEELGRRFDVLERSLTA